MTMKSFGAEIALCSVLLLFAISSADDPCLYECKDFTGSDICVTEELLCNHFPDCEDGVDESKCGCEGFTCKSDGICKDSTMVCNGSGDCFDNSDEANCTKALYKERFPWESDKNLCIKPCRYGRCYFDAEDRALCRCDAGYSGEFCVIQDPTATTEATTPQEQKPEEKFHCGSQEISEKLFCDGTVDCADKSDETNCTLHDYKKAKPHLDRAHLCLMPCKRTRCAFDHAFKAHCPCPEKSEGVFCENLIRYTTTSPSPVTPAQEKPREEAETAPKKSRSFFTSVILPAIGVAGLAFAIWLWMARPWAAVRTSNRPLV